MEAVFLYAGQGSQIVGMGKDFYQEYEEYREFVDSLELDFDFKKIMEEGPMQELSKTEYTQPCMAVLAAGITMLLEKHHIHPKAAMGLSLGEYGALYAAEVFDAKTYVDITAHRGKFMAEAAEGLACCMSAILGCEAKEVEEACKNYNKEGYVTVANYNCPGQYVICGSSEAVLEVENTLLNTNAKRCVRLQVSGPFHTKYMEGAGEKLKAYMERIPFQKPRIPVSSNVTGSFYQEHEDLKARLVEQVKKSVKLEENLRGMLQAGYDTFIEIGPGNAVSGFLKRTARQMGQKVTIHIVGTVEEFKKLIGE